MNDAKEQMVNDEVSLADVMDFFRRNSRLIALWGVAGALLAAAYIALTPDKFEARWQVQMAQFSGNNSSSNSNSEEPAALIQRLRMPTVYPVEVRKVCGVSEDGEFTEYLGGMLKIEVTKNVANAVEMKVVAPSQAQAMKCAEAIFTMIVMQQRGFIEERLAGRQAQLVQYQQALKEEQKQLEQIKKSELSNFGYLAKLDKLSWLRTRIDALQEEALLSQLHPARLIAPIHAPSKPVARKRGIKLLLGITLGLVLGVLYGVGRETLRRARLKD